MNKRTVTKATFLKRVKDTIKHYYMFRENDRVLVAVSGGADSVCLLNVLESVKRSLGIDTVIANMDHCLRGKESARDSDYVRKLSLQLGLPFEHKKVDVSSSVKKGASLEERARDERYRFFREAARRSGCNVIATGHTMDDQAETVIMRVIYGASPVSLSGIPPVREEKGLKLVRPLIRVSREQILDFLEKNGVGFVEDSSNSDVMFLRNKMRLEVLPFLEKYNPRVKRSLVNLSDAVREDLEYLQQQSRKAMEGSRNRTRISIKDIILQPKALRREVFKQLFTNAGGNVKKLSYRHWMLMDRFLRESEKGRSLDFPGDIRVTKKGSDLVFDKR
ncbi:MAG: tRNA lysidine(34) synthetase TilS [Candidatus Omnitrophica bacterium]|nr:tRNA lysidine(34) synthetase TilS [Candidatus Omnitrophota bacterium]